jgi:hypothetical protein
MAVSKLSTVPKKLISRELELPEAIWELNEFSALLRWFACDCAEHALRRERRCGVEADRRSVWALTIARQHSVGAVGDSHLLSARYAASDASRAAGSNGALDAAKASVEEGAVAAALGATRHAQRCASLDQSRAFELAWQVRRLHYLCDVWSICDHRATWLLFEQQCPIDPVPEAELSFF